jgi:hypothetical protein
MSAFTDEWAELQEHWRELVHSMQSNKKWNSGAPKWPEQASTNQSVALSDRVFRHAAGMLSFMGYEVGMKSDLTTSERREILAYVYHGRLPCVNTKAYTAEWGDPGSVVRLHKMKRTISTFIENARRKRSNMDVAIAQWMEDLEFIRRTFGLRSHVL